MIVLTGLEWVQNDQLCHYVPPTSLKRALKGPTLEGKSN